ncbi:hypothetical protein [Profundibacter sp.]|uniref:hypothetical protein n=1 Tax=Profundibacter sp. TaxID=3101071 RepID=UPI003D1510C0
MKSLILFVGLLALSACQEDPEMMGKTRAGIRAEQKECDAKGGSYQRAGMFGKSCIMKTQDAGKSCKTGKDCEGICFGDTHTCSAVTPMFGCFSMVEDDGKVVEICID